MKTFSTAIFTVLFVSSASSAGTKRTYDEYPPAYGIEISAAANAFGRIPFRSAQISTTRAFSLSLEYQPKFMQQYGIFGIGPTLSLYPIFKDPVTGHFSSLYSAGGLIRYQAHYFKRQPIVPVLAYSWEYFGYTFSDLTTGGFLMSGPTVGVWIYMNFIDSSSAAQFYLNQGVMRTYLILEAKSVSGSDRQTSVSGRSYFLGLRFEF